ncbi:MAG TPA: galactokinase [Pyrinomonadaceae bacterium]|nr:galactokinase [Pyrinomonadaceae bacterium]
MIDLSRLLDLFAEFSSRKPRVFSAPGRVNLIGEHTDYSEGFVLPMAASLRTHVAAAPREDRRIQVFSANMNGSATLSLDSPDSAIDSDRNWASYVFGVARTLVYSGFPIQGADLAILSDVPVGAGLSSSAALEVSVGYALTQLAGWEISPRALAIVAQKAEHLFVGAKSGLMDQLTATHGKKDHAMLIDCRSLDIQHIPMTLGAVDVIVCNTGVKHSLADSSYNQRRSECESALKLLQKKRPGARTLRDIGPNDLEFVNQLPEPECRRARHVVTENERTVRAAQALKMNDAVTVGSLMTQSHISLRDDFQVSSRELDIMVELAHSHRGSLGSRMMGGGFGGCTISLVAHKHLEDFSRHITTNYQRATGMKPDLNVISADDGVSELVPSKDDAKA